MCGITSRLDFEERIMLSLANRGLSTGMCQNICNNYTRAEEIFKLAEDERALDFRFIMGIGYAKDIETRHQYFDPRIDAGKHIPFPPINVEIAYPRPSFDDVIKVIKE